MYKMCWFAFFFSHFPQTRRLKYWQDKYDTEMFLTDSNQILYREVFKLAWKEKACSREVPNGIM